MQAFLADPSLAEAMANALPVDMVEPVDISNAILRLVCDDGRYVTGVTLPSTPASPTRRSRRTWLDE